MHQSLLVPTLLVLLMLLVMLVMLVLLVLLVLLVMGFLKTRLTLRCPLTQMRT
jgi:hypothetical protein